MRTTLDLDDRLLERARRRARSQGSTLTAIVESALAAYLAPRPRRGRAFKLRLKTEKGRYIGQVSLADRDALYEQMEGRL